MNVTHIIERDLIAKQAEAEQEMLRELEQGNYTFDNPLVKLNPYIISPLAAVVLFKTEAETAVTVTVRGKAAAGDISHTFPKARTHVLPVLGLYPARENIVEIQLYQGARAIVRIKTEPTGTGVAELISFKHSATDSGLIVLAPPGGAALTGFDYSGDVRWYIDAALHMAVKRLRNGRLLTGTHRMPFPPYSSTGLYELDMVGKIYREYLLPGGYHHDQLEMPNSDLLVLTQEPGGDTVEDICALIDRESGAAKKIWNFADFIKPGEGASGKWTQEDWFHCNALWYNEQNRSITFSGRHIDAMVNIDYDSGALNWILGDPEGWPADKLPYFFKPEGDGFEWQYAQHSALHTPNGDVMCFDNGTLRSKNKERYLPNKENFSRAVRYSINTESMTVRQVWEFGRELGQEFFSQHISNVEYYRDGHYLIHSGGVVLYDGEAVEDLRKPGAEPDPRARFESVTVEQIDGVKTLEMRVKGNFYRATKLTPYYDGANLELGPGVKAGTLGVSKLSEGGTVAKPCGDPVPESCLAHIIEESDCVTLKARFEKGLDAAFILEREGDVRRYKVNTGENRFAAMSCRPYIEPDERNTSTFVSKYGLSGEYSAKIELDGLIYDTGVSVCV